MKNPRQITVVRSGASYHLPTYFVDNEGIDAIPILCICGIIVWIYLLYRNQKVAQFRKKINQMCYDYNTHHINLGSKRDSAWDWCFDKMPSYDKMLFSIKKVKLESFLTEDQIKRLQEKT